MISDVRKQTITYIVSAFGIVAGLAWNDAIKSLIEFIFPAGSGSLVAKFIYAILVTLAVVLVTGALMRWAGREENNFR